MATCHAAIWVLLNFPRMFTEVISPEVVKSEAAEGMAISEGLTAAKMKLLVALPAVIESIEVAARMADAVRLPTWNLPRVVTPTEPKAFRGSLLSWPMSKR